MKLGIVSDTHNDRMNALPYIMQEFDKAKVEIVIHCGDISPAHVKAELFNNLPVICALNEKNPKAEEFNNPPKHWHFTYPCDPPEDPKNRIVDLADLGLGMGKFYVGHKRSFDFLIKSKRYLEETLQKIRKDQDGVRWLFSGHVHHQTYAQGRLISYVNPGAVEDSFDGYEYAIIDTASDQIIFSRILAKKPIRESLNIGIISDSADISDFDPEFWQQLANVLKQHQVTHLIVIGNIDLKDIGKEALEDFQVYVNLLPSQRLEAPGGSANWHILTQDEPIVQINGYKFLIDYGFGRTMLGKSEEDLLDIELEKRIEHPRLNYILFGLTNEGFYEEGEQLRYINPGDINRDRNFVVISLPKNEITFGHVPLDPLPPLEK